MSQSRACCALSTLEFKYSYCLNIVTQLDAADQNPQIQKLIRTENSL